MKRVLSALVLGAAVVYLVLFAGGLSGSLVVAAVVLLAANEMINLVEASGGLLRRQAILAGSAMILFAGIAGGPYGLSAGLVAGGMLVSASALQGGSVKGSVKRAAFGIFILFIPVWCLAHLLFFLQTNTGRRSLMFLLVCVWVSDSSAYYFGKAFGRRRLAPETSPNKTVVGSIAGILGSVFAAFLLGLSGFVTWPAYFVFLSGLVLSVIAQGGDLFESMIKREAGVKDSGRLIPGHGGILDRVDALLFAVPVFFYSLLWLQRYLT